MNDFKHLRVMLANKRERCTANTDKIRGMGSVPGKQKDTAE